MVLELLDARPLHLGGAVGGAERLVQLLPTLLPPGELPLGRLQRLRRGGLGGLRALELRRRARDLLGELGELALVALDVRAELRQRRARLPQVGALALTQLAGVLDRLLEA